MKRLTIQRHKLRCLSSLLEKSDDVMYLKWDKTSIGLNLYDTGIRVLHYWYYFSNLRDNYLLFLKPVAMFPWSHVITFGSRVLAKIILQIFRKWWLSAIVGMCQCRIRPSIEKDSIVLNQALFPEKDVVYNKWHIKALSLPWHHFRGMGITCFT